MTLEDECRKLMFLRDKIKELKKIEESTKNNIIEYLNNHGQSGIIFKHNKKPVTIMVESTMVKKHIDKKEREKNLQNLLKEQGLKDFEAVSREIFQKLKWSTPTKKIKENLKIK